MYFEGWDQENTNTEYISIIIDFLFLTNQTAYARIGHTVNTVLLN